MVSRDWNSHCTKYNTVQVYFSQCSNSIEVYKRHIRFLDTNKHISYGSHSNRAMSSCNYRCNKINHCMAEKIRKYQRRKNRLINLKIITSSAVEANGSLAILTTVALNCPSRSGGKEQKHSQQNHCS